MASFRNALQSHNFFCKNQFLPRLLKSLITVIEQIFDSVPQNLLIHKLQTFGINKEPVLIWMKHYLHNRQQWVKINGTNSAAWLQMKSGGPLGATRGPLTFLLYVNDLPNSIHNQTRISIFADDTKILRSINSKDDIRQLTLTHYTTRVYIGE